MLFRKPSEFIPDVPPKINRAHLTNSRLLDPEKNAEEINHIMTSLMDCPDGYYSKKDPLFSKKTFSEKEGRYLQYSIIKENKHYYAVYRGKNDKSEIAEGGFGVLKYAQDIESGQFVAVKVINPLKHESTKNQPIDHSYLAKTIQSETDILNTLHRLPSYSTSSDSLDHKHSFYLYKRKQQLLDPKKLVVVMDLEKGIDAFNYIVKNQGTLSTEMCLLIAKNMVSAWRELFAKGILHRDIKLENFLIDESGQVKLIDFGFAVRFDTLDRNPCFYDLNLPGTPLYLSPELHESHRYSEKSDVYAMGLCFSYMFHYCFKGTQDEQLISIKNRFGKLSGSMLKKYPVDRPSMAEIAVTVDQLMEQSKKVATPECAVTLKK